MRRFAGKAALVTGSSSGIGAACARRFLDEGARVACLDLPGTAVASSGPECMRTECDVSDEPSMMRALSGAIIALASTAALRGSRAGLGPYTASKHAVIGLVKTAALESAADGIRVNAVCPSPVDTPMMRAIEAGNDGSDPAAFRARIEAGVPLGRYAETDEIAALIAFLATDEARYLTGASDLADRGIMA